MEPYETTTLARKSIHVEFTVKNIDRERENMNLLDLLCFSYKTKTFNNSRTFENVLQKTVRISIQNLYRSKSWLGSPGHKTFYSSSLSSSKVVIIILSYLFGQRCHIVLFYFTEIVLDDYIFNKGKFYRLNGRCCSTSVVENAFPISF